MMKRPSYHFLHFTRKEKNGSVFILFIICLLIAVPFFYGLFFTEKNIAPNDLAAMVASLKIKTADSAKKYYPKNNEYDQPDDHPQYNNKENFSNNVYSGQLFNFDPNSLPASGWKKLGLKDKTIWTIQNYLSKGGRFRQPEDIKKIWGLHEGLVQQLLPYIKIDAPDNTFQSRPAYETKKQWVKESIVPIDINNADSTSLDRLPGIGSKLSQRIIAFRDRLGGFYSVEQVAETYGLPDSTFKKIKDRLVLNHKTLRQININTGTQEELKMHPYIRYQLANAIVQYRTQHGNFTHIEDIKKIMMMNDELFDKLAPYLDIQ